MKQVVQALSGGPVRVVEVPKPTISSTEVLVRTSHTIVSPGTEAAVAELAQSGAVAKVRARPDLVRQVMRKARNEGLRSTTRSVRGRLAEDLPLGYSGSGIVLEVGEVVTGITPGSLVATGGAGKANHAEFQAVPGLLCAPVPDGVTPRSAAFATIASIALHGIRLASAGPGAKVAVLGLGLVGQLAVRLARASGLDVVGIDVAEAPVQRAREAGFNALVDSGAETTSAVLDWSRGRGCDAVLITAASKSSAAVVRSTELCRDRAEVVVVGDVGLDIDRRPFYEKELSLQFARSYGPGRYDLSYEVWGVDYPPGYVRWTEGRNMEAVLDLLASGALQVEDLITHSFPIAEADRAYKMIKERSEPYLGIEITYKDEPVDRPIVLRQAQPTAAPAVGLIGAGAFASSVLVPAMKKADFDRFVSVTSASGTTARTLAQRQGFEKVVSGAETVIEDPDVNVVVIATPHSTHAELTVRALKAGKHVFCEKPLALSFEELDEIEDALESSAGVLWVGFNRRWSAPVESVRRYFSGRGPMTITYRVTAAPPPPGHWYEDQREGGRILGEVCHFIDTCCAIAGDTPRVVAAIHNDTRGASQDVTVSLGFPTGSIATIAYTSAGPARLPKERIEVLGGGRSAVIDDFKGVRLDGKATRLRSQDKGHVGQLHAFMKAIQTSSHDHETAMLTSMRATLSCASESGQPL